MNDLKGFMRNGSAEDRRPHLIVPGIIIAGRGLLPYQMSGEPVGMAAVAEDFDHV